MYLIMFGVGVGFIVLTLVIGEVAELDGAVFGFLRPSLIAVFLVVMGGFGLLLTPRLEGLPFIVMVISFVCGVIIAGLLNRFIIAPLYKTQNTSAFNMQDTIGATASVISPIPQGGYGKIRYNISGSVVTSPAKSEDGTAIKAGEHVSILYVEKNTYFVRRKEDPHTPQPN
ncbi:MAG: NfeD family protein [Defluviitaleaceae bacterium]|nr:NfeD family protein [Defluviitaleaceae bacterium]MCL2239096.1 NfeD family protein [Defluviitaleaceae bacterium]